MRGLDDAERNFIRSTIGRPEHTDLEKRGEDLTPSELQAYERLLLRGLVAVSRCRCGDWHVEVTSLGKEAFELDAAARRRATG